MKSKPSLLGGLTVNEFLRDYWQKKPLLIRQAFPAFGAMLDPQQLISLACTEDVQARMVTQQRGKFGDWTMDWYSPTSARRNL